MLCVAEGMKLPFSLGLGAILGSGQQYMPWITLTDTVRAIEFIIHRPDITGPVNLCAPTHNTNAEFTGESVSVRSVSQCHHAPSPHSPAAFASALSRPVFLRAPESLLVKILGEFAVETLFASSRVEPRVLTTAGFTWKHPTLNIALPAIVTEKL